MLWPSQSHTDDRKASALTSSSRMFHVLLITLLDVAEAFSITDLFQMDTECGQRPIMPDSPTSRIVGGTTSQFGMWPFYGALYYKEELLCGTTVIDEQWAITAAHCLFEKSDVDNGDQYQTMQNATIGKDDDIIRVRKRRHAQGSRGMWEGYRMRNMDRLVVRGGMIRNSSLPPFDQFRLIDAIIPHAMFNPKSGRNDLALLRLHAPWHYSAYVMPACLPDSRISFFASNGQRRKCVAVGYGSLGSAHRAMSDVLMEVELPVQDSSECSRIPTINVDTKIDRTQICAGTDDGGKDTCQGDSGGPLLCQVCKTEGVCSWYLFGITSTGSGNCASPMTPGVYTKVAEYDDWIHAAIANYDNSQRDHICDKEHKFTCLLTNCIPDSKVCDHNWDCAFGEDELCH